MAGFSVWIWILSTTLLVAGLMGFRANAQGKIAAYPIFNGSIKDESGNGNNGFTFGATRVVSDRFGDPCGALELDGKSGYIEIPSSPSLETPQYGLSLLAWVRISPEPGISYRGITLFCKGEVAEERPDNPQYRFQVFQFIRNSTVSLNTKATQEDPNFLSHSLPLNTWFHTAMVYNGSEMIWYVNGDEWYKGAYSIPLQANRHPLHIGKDIPGQTEFFAGALDDIEIHNQALDPVQVLNSYLKGNSPKAQPNGSLFQLSTLPDLKLTAQVASGKASATWNEPMFSPHPCKNLVLKQLRGPNRGNEIEPGKFEVVYGLMEDDQIRALSAFFIEVLPPAKQKIISPLRTICLPDTEWVIQDSGGFPFFHRPPEVRSSEGKVLQNLASGPRSGTRLQAGEYMLVYETTDEAGARERCTRRILVRFEPPPSPRKPVEIAELGTRTTPEPKAPSLQQPKPQEVKLPESTPLAEIKPDPEPPPPSPPAEKPVPERPVFKHIEDSIHVQSRAKLKDRTFTLVSFDNVVADGDRIAIYLNDSLVVQDKVLKNHPNDRKLGKNMIDGVITLKPGRNYLIVKALNTGGKGLNTATIRLYRGVATKDMKMGANIAFSTALAAKQGIAGALEIYIEP
jgi:hypothetical protein